MDRVDLNGTDDFEREGCNEWKIVPKRGRSARPDKTHRQEQSTPRQGLRVAHRYILLPDAINTTPKTSTQSGQKPSPSAPLAPTRKATDSPKRSKGAHTSPQKAITKIFIPEHKTATKKRHAIEPKIEIEPDDEGKAAWRRGDKPLHSITLPPSFNATTLKTESRNACLGQHEAGMIPVVAYVMEYSGAYIASSLSKCGICLSFYGRKQNVKTAVAEIELWIRETRSEREPGVKAFGKVKAHNEKEEKKFARELNEQQFKKSLPMHIPFNFEMSFEFPQDKLKCSPEDKLGINFEALDRIRMQCRTYIERSLGKDCGANPIFKLVSNHEDLIQEAHDRLKGIVFQICAAGYDPAHVAILVGLADLRQNDVFELLPQRSYESVPGRKVSITKTTERCMRFKRVNEVSAKASSGLQSSGVESVVNVGPGDLDEDKLEILVDSIQDALKYLRWSKCNAEFHVHLGVYALGSWKRNKKTYSKDELLDLIDEVDDEDKFTIKQFGDMEMGEQLLSRFLAANSLLLPKDPLCESLCNIKPCFAMSFIIKNLNDNSLYRLELVTELAEDAEMRKILERWSKLDKNADEPKRFLNTSIVDLRDGLAWDFDLRVTNATRTVPTQWVTAAKDINLDITKALAQDYVGNWVNLPKYTQFPVESFELARTWSFNIKGCDYATNISFHQNFTRRENTAEFDAYGPYWGLDVSHNQWPMLLIELDRVHRIGKSASWNADIEQFFPSDGIGKAPDPAKSKDNAVSTTFPPLIGISAAPTRWETDKHGRISPPSGHDSLNSSTTDGLKRLFAILKLVKGIAMGAAAPLEHQPTCFNIEASFDVNSDSDCVSDSD